MLEEYLRQYFPGRFGIGARRPMGRHFKRYNNHSGRPKVVVGHSFVERIYRGDEPEGADSLEINWLGYSGASIQQLLTIVYELIDGEYKYFRSQFIVLGWENSIMNGLTLDEAESIVSGVVEEQRGLDTHKVILGECPLSPGIIKAGKSAVAFRINRLVKEAARRCGAHALDLERSVGKVDSRKELVGVKQSMWAEKGTEGYHPSEAGARRMAMWLRNYFQHGMDRSDPSYPPKKPIAEGPPTPKPEVASAFTGEGRKISWKEMIEVEKEKEVPMEEEKDTQDGE